MLIYIPTRSRPFLCAPDALPLDMRSRIRLVIREDEQTLYKPQPYRKIVLPRKVNGLCQTRQWIIENAEGNICMMDDDIKRFVYKPHLGAFGGVRRADNRQIGTMFAVMRVWLNGGVVCASTADRLALARPASSDYEEPNRVGQVMFINCDAVQRKGFKFRLPIYHDQDFALQIVRSGNLTRISRRYGHDMRPTYGKGGLATYRDQNTITESASILVQLHPGLVTLKWREKHGFKIPSRLIKWKQAYNEGATK